MKNPFKKVKAYWKTLGPGLTTGAADDDPSGIATYSQVGASRGFGLIWLSLFSLPLMAVVQEMCGRIGLVTGEGLATNIKKHYSKSILLLCTFLLVFANVFNIGADLGAMAKATQLIVPTLPFVFLVIFFAIFSLALQVYIPYKTYAKYLKYLALVLLSYIFAAFLVDIDWSIVLRHSIIPSFNFSKDDILLVCAVLGTTISPYLFFWQTSQEVEDQIMKGDDTLEKRIKNTKPKDIKDMRTDTWSGAIISNIVMFFIIVLCSATLFENGITNISSAGEAASALRPFAGDFTFLLFTIGIVGTGLLAIPVLAGSASYAVSEALEIKEGLFLKFKEAHSFYFVIIIAVLLGIILNFVGIDPIKSLIYSAILNGIISPIMIFFIVRISGNKTIMGNYANGKWASLFGYFAVIIMSAVAISTLYFLLF